MATARKRGDNWRCLAYVGTVNGKRKYKSFTAPTKKEAERLASSYEKEKASPMTVGEAMLKYIDIKEPVLSPSTIRAYRRYLPHYAAIESIRLDKLTDAVAQEWVSDLVRSGMSPKYVRNVFGLLSSSVRIFGHQIRATLPKNPRRESYTPTNAEVQAILSFLDDEMQIAVMLAAYCSLRCGEICALTSDDLNGNILTVSKAMSINPDGTYTVRQPKTAGSVRQVPVPAFVLERLQPITGKIIKSRTPLMISGKFHKEMAKAGHTFRFHDLRHFFASELAKNRDIPLSTIERMGGWSAGSPVLRQVYIGAQEAEMQKNMAAAAASFDALQAKKDPQ